MFRLNRLECILVLYCFGTACGAIMFAVVTGITISCSLCRWYRSMLIISQMSMVICLFYVFDFTHRYLIYINCRGHIRTHNLHPNLRIGPISYRVTARTGGKLPRTNTPAYWALSQAKKKRKCFEYDPRILPKWSILQGQIENIRLGLT